MKNKSGFIFIETIVTIVVLATALLYLYGSFNNTLIKEKNRIYYDDVAYIYRANYIKEFFNKNSLLEITEYLNEDNPLIIIGCDYQGIFSEDNIGLEDNYACHSLVDNLHITNISLAIKDLSFIENCNDNSHKCSYLNNYSLEELTYLKSLNKVDTESSYLFIVEFTQTKDGGYCDDRCTKSFAWLEL